MLRCHGSNFDSSREVSLQSWPTKKQKTTPFPKHAADNPILFKSIISGAVPATLFFSKIKANRQTSWDWSRLRLFIHLKWCLYPRFLNHQQALVPVPCPTPTSPTLEGPLCFAATVARSPVSGKNDGSPSQVLKKRASFTRRRVGVRCGGGSFNAMGRGWRMSEKGSWQDLLERAMSKLSIRVRYRIPKGFQLFIMGKSYKIQAQTKNLRTLMVLMNNPWKTTKPAPSQRQVLKGEKGLLEGAVFKGTNDTFLRQVPELRTAPQERFRRPSDFDVEHRGKKVVVTRWGQTPRCFFF